MIEIEALPGGLATKPPLPAHAQSAILGSIAMIVAIYIVTGRLPLPTGVGPVHCDIRDSSA
jgi:hypothetical protein